MVVEPTLIMKRLSLIGILGFSLIIAACIQRTFWADYSVVNRTGDKLQKAKISIGKHHSFSLGVLITDSHKSYMGDVPFDEINATVLKWTEKDGRTETRTFNVTREEITDKRQRQFIINPDRSITRDWRFPEKGP